MGAAVAGFQVDMGCPSIDPAACEDRASDWYQWITTDRIRENPILFQSSDPPTSGPGFYELYAQDLDRAANELHSNALRLSIEYSRIFPNPTFGTTGYDALKSIADPTAIAYYHAIFAAMKARGLKPLVTLNHYTLPLWLHDGNACNQDFSTCTARGWAAPDVIVPEIAKYAGFVGQEFGGEVDLWATENEPFTAVVLPGYIVPSSTRVNPPGLYLQIDAAKTAFSALIQAHARMYDAVKGADTVDADGDGTAASVGLVYCFEAVSPLTGDDTDNQAAANARYFLNDMFVQGVASGIVDANWDGNYTTSPDLANRLDWLGVNYYDRVYAQANVIPTPLSSVSTYLTFNMLNLNTTADPSGILDVLRDVKKWNRPIYVTETGIDQASDDSAGASWVAQTAQYVQEARQAGIPVQGYFAWSLMDNYEWNHGMSMRFGMYAVDPNDATKARTARPAVGVFAAIAAAGGVVPASVAANYPVQGYVPPPDDAGAGPDDAALADDADAAATDDVNANDAQDDGEAGAGP
jgi:beta-glucosidase/6-phospho-beta-glucosidase/beta-galactosidase